VVSPIVTRGFGADTRIITRGFGGVFIPAAVTAASRLMGGTKRKAEKYHRDITEFTVTAIILAVNGIEVIQPKTGTARGEIVRTDMKVSAVLQAINRLGYLTERIIINAFRIVRRGFKKIED
jgi:hypothetical protein